MKFQLHFFFFLFCFLMTSTSLWAQERPSTSSQKINEAYQQGTLTLDQKVLYQFYALHDEQRLPSQYRSFDSRPIKCGTPANIHFYQNQDQLSASTIQEVESMINPQVNASETYTTPSERFVIHYETSGDDAVPLQDSDGNGTPDYVEKVAAAADSSYRHEVQNLGYMDPLISEYAYEIVIRNLSSYYGITYPYNGSTYIEIENDFAENFPPNDHPDDNQTGAIYATMAHELKHAIQYANSKWYGFPGEPTSPHSFNWSEMDATLMEEVVYDNVNDYYNYLERDQSIFNSPENSIPGAYWQVSWSIYFEEKIGSKFWVDVWSRIKERYDEEQNTGSEEYLGMFEAITTTLSQSYETSVEREFSESHVWHIASGDFSPLDYGFEERTNYPTPKLAGTITGHDSLQNSLSITSMATNYFQVEPEGMEQDQVQISFKADTTNYSAGAIAYYKDGSTDTFFGTARVNKELILKTTWDWKEIEKIGITASNLSRGSEITLNVEASSYEAQFIALDQNYPNPFNPSTTIPFKLLEQSNIQLRIFDVTGRLVRTLVDKTLPAGSHELEFNADGLASGIYIYHLITDKKTVAKKMTLVK